MRATRYLPASVREKLRGPLGERAAYIEARFGPQAWTVAELLEHLRARGAR